MTTPKLTKEDVAFIMEARNEGIRMGHIAHHVYQVTADALSKRMDYWLTNGFLENDMSETECSIDDLNSEIRLLNRQLAAAQKLIESYQEAESGTWAGVDKLNKLTKEQAQ